MSRLVKTPEDRAELRERRTKRRARSARNVARTWAEKDAKVRAPIDEAANEWDRQRARIKGLKDRQREDHEWSRLAAHIRSFGDGP